MRRAWKTRLAGWPWPNSAGFGIAPRMVSTRSPERRGRAPGAAAHDGAGDGPRVALLAVAVEDGRASSRSSQLVDEVGGGARLGRIHAHVERRVGGVREAALGLVDLHRRHAEVEQDRVGAARRWPPGCAAPSAKLPRTKRARHVGVRVAEGGEVLAHARVAVDRDVRAAAVHRLRQQRARARRRRTCRRRRSCRARRRATPTTSRASTGRCGREARDSRAKRSATSSMLPSNSLTTSCPRLAIPDLQPVAGCP